MSPEETCGGEPRKRLYLLSNFSTLDLLDCEHLISRQMTLVGENYEVHQRGKKRLELVVLLPAEAGIEQGFDPADDPGSRRIALQGTIGKQLLRLRLQA